MDYNDEVVLTDIVTGSVYRLEVVNGIVKATLLSEQTIIDEEVSPPPPAE